MTIYSETESATDFFYKSIIMTGHICEANKQPLGSRGFYDKMAPIRKGALDQKVAQVRHSFQINNTVL